MKNRKEKNIFVIGWSVSFFVLLLMIAFGINLSVQDTMAASVCPALTPNEVDGVCCPIGYNYTTTTDSGVTLCHTSFFTVEDGTYFCKAKVNSCTDPEYVWNGYTCSEVTNEDGTTTSYVQTPLISYCSVVATSKVTTFTVTYNGNGGTISGKTSDTCVVSSGNTSCDITSLPTATREGYTFKGWSISSDEGATGTTDKITLSDDLHIMLLGRNKLGCQERLLLLK